MYTSNIRLYRQNIKWKDTLFHNRGYYQNKKARTRSKLINGFQHLLPAGAP